MSSSEPHEDRTAYAYPGFEEVYRRLSAVGHSRLTLWHGAGVEDICDINRHIAITAEQSIGITATLFASVEGIVEPFQWGLKHDEAEEEPTEDPFRIVERFFEEPSPDKLLTLYGAHFRSRTKRAVEPNNIRFLQNIITSRGKLGRILVTGTDMYGGKRGLVPDQSKPHQVLYGSLGSGGSPIVHADDQRTIEVPPIPTGYALGPRGMQRRNRFSPGSPKRPPAEFPTYADGHIYHLGKTRLGVSKKDFPKESE
jgi:hypothetical protein